MLKAMGTNLQIPKRYRWRRKSVLEINTIIMSVKTFM